MKVLPIAVALAVVAVPIFASAGDDQNATSTTSQKTLSTVPVQEVDSPLVRAAKATGRLGKKPTMVITNETLLKSGGHFTTTKTQAPLPPPPPPPESQDLKAAQQNAQRLRLEAAQKAKNPDNSTKVRAAQRSAADLYGDSVEERSDDPAVQEHVMQQSTSSEPVTPTQAPPQTKKPPL